ncbi:MAG: 5-bromo-4-chloroindolyl phosphate hydrolysis family protein [Selenomonadaceae bacterium]|nr:5-bromo-4-chloroindolyl phosphate hydrolysis family protein [Selenomonadaceae bacterium]
MKYFYLVLGVALTVGGGLLVGGDSLWLGLGFIAMGLGAGAQGVKKIRQENLLYRLKQAENISAERAALLQASYDKAVSDFQTLDEARKKLTEPALLQQVNRLQTISRDLLRYLEKHPEKIALAQRFIDYYQDRAVVLVEKYQDFAATHLTGDEILSMQERLRTALNGLDEAYEEQFRRILSDQFMDLDAELKVMEQTMAAEGIKVRDTTDTAYPPTDFTGEDSPQFGKLRPFPQGVSSTAGLIIPPEQLRDVKRTRVIQALCGIFLGGFGVHKFYQRKFFQGVLYVLFSWTFLPGLIGFCEGMRYMFMRLEDFYEEYYLKR